MPSHYPFDNNTKPAKGRQKIEREQPFIEGRRTRTGVARATKTSRMSRILLTFGAIVLAIMLVFIGISLSPAFGPLTTATTPAPSLEQTSVPALNESGKQTESITLAHNRVEIADQLADYAADYSTTTGQTVEIMTIGDGADYQETLKALQQTGTFPDIFVIEGKDDFDQWQDHAADLTGESWIADTDFSFSHPDGYVVGFPVDLEGYGMAFNRDLLDQAQIDPATLTNYEAYQAAFAKLDQMKVELGIDAVISMSVSSQRGMAWASGQHNFNIYLSSGLTYGNTVVIDKLLQGQVELPRITQYAEYVSLLFSYADQGILLNGNYDDQAQAFASGRTVFIPDANWLDPTLVNSGATFNMGFAPHGAFIPSTNGIFAAPTAWYCVNQQSPKAAEAKAFLAAMVSTEAGQRYLVDKAGLVPAFRSVRLTPARPLARSLKDWSAAGRVYSMNQDLLPEGFALQTLAPIYEQLAAGEINAVQFASQLTSAIESLAPGNLA